MLFFRNAIDLTVKKEKEEEKKRKEKEKGKKREKEFFLLKTQTAAGPEGW